MSAWRDLEREFDELHQSLIVLGCRLDRTWGENRTVSWRLAGGAVRLQTHRFESLAIMAGRLLETIDPAELPEDVARQANPYDRWLTALWSAASPRTEHGFETAEGGVKSLFFFGSLDHPAAVSANLCLRFAAITIPVSSGLDHQLAAPRYATVQEHWGKATQYLQSGTPDFPNAAKEAVCAVEALAQIVTRQSSATLGECIKSLRTSKRIASPLLKGLEELWGFTSDSPGVRHGSSRAITLTAAEARYVVDQAAAALLLVLTLDSDESPAAETRSR
jgi:hypothetical protein